MFHEDGSARCLAVDSEPKAREDSGHLLLCCTAVDNSGNISCSVLPVANSFNAPALVFISDRPSVYSCLPLL